MSKAYRTEKWLSAPQRIERGIWSGMKQRCLNPKNKCFHGYGKRGIRVCDRWMKFAGFFEDMGPRPSELHSLERIDNDGNYEPSNVRWGTPTEQANNKRQTLRITYSGRTLSATQWASELGISPRTFTARLGEYGWTVERAMQEPVDASKNWRAAA